MAAAVAAAIDAPLDVAVARKIGAPGQPEFGIGAITAEGRAQYDEVVCVASPATFGGVGLWYHDFTQITDDECSTSSPKASPRDLPGCWGRRRTGRRNR